MLEDKSQLALSKNLHSVASNTQLLYRTLIENTGTAIILVEDDMTISFANRKFCEATGYSKDEIENKVPFLHFIHPDDRARLQSYHLMRRQAFGSAPHHYEGRFINQSSEVVYFYNTVVFLPQTKQSIASFIDITTLKVKEKESIERLEMIKQQACQLEQKNITLEQVLNSINQEKADYISTTKETIEKLLLPQIIAAQKGLKEKSALERLALLEKTVTEFESSLRLNDKTLSRTLSSKELQICNLIKQNFSSRDIARNLAISLMTVATHRKNIRSKLGLTNASVNLHTYLMSL
jgi:PAS domain S-box-containing protein